MSGALFNEARTDERPLRPVEKPGPGLFDFNWDATSASAEQSYYDVGGRSQELRAGEIAAAAAELARINGKRPTDYYAVMPGEPIGNNPIVDEDRFWRDLREVRRTRPDALKDLGSDRADYDKRRVERLQAGAADRQARMAKGGALGNLLGGAAGAFTDPVNIVTLPIGGGSGSIARSIVVNSLVNAGIEAAEQPVIALERDQQGGELTLGEAATNVVGAGVGAGVLTGAGHGLSAAANKVFSLDDRALASALRQSVKGDWDLTPQQMAALHVLERSGDVDASSPYAHTYEGLGAHAAKIDEVLGAMSRFPEPSSAPALTPANVPSSGIAPDFGRAWGAIVGIEGGANRDGSFRVSPAGAIGPAQLMPGTAPEALRLAGYSPDDPRWRTDTAVNIAAGQALYRDLLRQFEGDPVKAAAAYNAGAGSARRGTGVRGAMARAERAGVPNDWVSFLPAETRAYVANFRRRTGMSGESVIADAGGDVGDGVPFRSPDLDAERPAVDFGEQPDLLDVPQLRRDAFPDEASYRLARSVDDAETLGLSPAATRDAVWRDARDRLMADKAGEAQGALFHPELGAIDVKWGNSKGGLGKIAEKHPEVLEDLPALLETMGIKSLTENRAVLQSLDHRAVVRLDFDGKAQKWLLSAYQLKGKAPPPADYRGAGVAAQDRSPARGASGDIGEMAENGNAPIPATRRGDFFEIDGEPAARVAKALDVVLTKRNGVDMVGIPAHVFDRWTDELAEKGIHVVDAASPPPTRTAAASDLAEAEGLNGPPVVDQVAAKSFDDPAGEGAAAQAESLWHDIRAGGDEVRARKVDLGDGKGERSIGEIDDELAQDLQDIDTIEACLRDMPKGDAE